MFSRIISVVAFKSPGEPDSAIEKTIMKRIRKIVPEKTKTVYKNEKFDSNKLIPILGMTSDLKEELSENLIFKSKETVKLSKKTFGDPKLQKIYDMSTSSPPSSRRVIAEEVGMSKSTVYLKQKDMGLQ